MYKLYIERKKVIILGSIVSLVLGLGGIAFYFMPKTETIEAYQTTLETLVSNTRSGQAKWEYLLRGGSETSYLSFTDLCTGYYSEKFRDLGTNFIEEATNFKALQTKAESKEYMFPNMTSYEQYFGTYAAIGNGLINFADYVDTGAYQRAIGELQQLMALYDTMPVLT